MSPQNGSAPVVPPVAVVASVSPAVPAEVVVPDAEAEADPPVAVVVPVDALVDALSPELAVPAVPVVAVPADVLSLVAPPPLQPKTRARAITRDTLDRSTEPWTAAEPIIPALLLNHLRALQATSGQGPHPRRTLEFGGGELSPFVEPCSSTIFALRRPPPDRDRTRGGPSSSEEAASPRLSSSLALRPSSR
jgi:hypothetical protein